jgi:hypothetical protein
MKRLGRFQKLQAKSSAVAGAFVLLCREISFEKSLKCLAVPRFVAAHFVNRIMDCVEIGHGGEAKSVFKSSWRKVQRL